MKKDINIEKLDRELFKAASTNDVVKFKKIIEENPDYEFDYDHYLLEACSEVSFDIVQYILQTFKKADINVSDEEGFTPLISAVLFTGINDIYMDSQHETQEIRDALTRDRINLIQMLLANGADPGIQSEEFKTALDYAKIINDKDVISILEKHIGKK